MQGKEKKKKKILCRRNCISKRVIVFNSSQRQYLKIKKKGMFKIEQNKRNEFLQKQLELLLQRQKMPDIVGWQDINDFRHKYGIEEHRDTTAKGSKLLYEYLDAGWTLTTNSQGETQLTSEKEDDDVLLGKKTVTINADGSITHDGNYLIESGENLRDPDFLLKLHDYDPRFFEVVRSTSSKRGTVKGKMLSSCNITVKLKTSPDITRDNIVEWFRTLDRKYTEPSINYNDNYLNGDKLLLIDISDLHLNLQATLFSTGNEYNCKIAETLFFYVINDVVSRTKSYNFNKIIFTIGGDMLNSDNLQGTTTKGTPQDNELPFYDSIELLYAMTVKAISMLSRIAPVDVIYISSNHDNVSGFKLALYIAGWFRKNDRVKVDTSPLPRKYVKFGKTLFVFAHDAKESTLPQLIADEARDLWSQVETVEVFLQHKHTEIVLLEKYNMRIQRLPTVSAKSKWTVDEGYGSKRQCKSFIFDKEDGCTDVLYTPISQRVLKSIKD